MSEGSPPRGATSPLSLLAMLSGLVVVAVLVTAALEPIEPGLLSRVVGAMDEAGAPPLNQVEQRLQLLYPFLGLLGVLIGIDLLWLRQRRERRQADEAAKGNSLGRLETQAPDAVAIVMCILLGWLVPRNIFSGLMTLSVTSELASHLLTIVGAFFIALAMYGIAYIVAWLGAWLQGRSHRRRLQTIQTSLPRAH